MQTPLRALDLFCGAGGVSVGLRAAGFDVVGVDIQRQPHYPFKDSFILRDACNLLPSFVKEFDFIWASPPCQRYSVSSTVNRGAFPDLVNRLRVYLKKTGKAYCIENVPKAPLSNPFMLCGRMFGLPLVRHRIFETNFAVKPPKHKEHDGKEIPVYGNGTSIWYARKHGRNVSIEDKRRAMAISWMPLKNLNEAIPPAYAEFIGRRAKMAVSHHCISKEEADKHDVLVVKFIKSKDYLPSREDIEEELAARISKTGVRSSLNRLSKKGVIAFVRDQHNRPRGWKLL